MKSMYQGSVLGVTFCRNNFRPKKHRCLGKYQHSSCHFHKSTISSFNNAVLLRSAWNTFLMSDANTFIKLKDLFVNKLSFIVCADDSNGFVEAYLQLFDKFDDNL